MNFNNIIQFDLYAYNIFLGSAEGFLTKFLLFLTKIGGPESLLAISAALILVFWLYNKKQYVVQFILTMGMSAMTVLVLKRVIQRARPIYGLIKENGYSFPSGHALVACVFFPLLIYITKKYIHSAILKNVFILVMILLMIGICFSRLYLGVHYTSDVVIGGLIGLIISSLSILISEHYRKNKKKEIEY